MLIWKENQCFLIHWQMNTNSFPSHCIQQLQNSFNKETMSCHAQQCPLLCWTSFSNFGLCRCGGLIPDNTHPASHWLPFPVGQGEDRRKETRLLGWVNSSSIKKAKAECQPFECFCETGIKEVKFSSVSWA